MSLTISPGCQQHQVQYGTNCCGWGRWLVKSAVIPISPLCLYWIGAHFKRLRELNHLPLPCLEQALNVFVEDPTTIIPILPGKASEGQSKH